MINSKSSMLCYYANVLTESTPNLDDKISDFKKTEGKCPSFPQQYAYNSGMNSKLSSPCTVQCPVAIALFSLIGVL